MIIQPGTDIGRYHILEQIGEGGMARVYKALDTNINAEVAVKFIRVDDLPAGQIQKTIERFRTEARKMARLSHPHIVPVSDYGEFEETPFLVMPLLGGGSLKKFPGAQMHWRTAAALLTPVAEALAYTHSKGIIHRDVKPGNILLTEAEDPMLTDFGIAKIIDAAEARQLTMTGSIIGTPEYMAPEQYLSTAESDARVDMYALGIVYYELVTGRKPFIADTPPAVMIKHARDPLPRPKNFVPDLPDEVEFLLMKALAKQPADRFRDMKAMAVELGKLSNMLTKEEQEQAQRQAEQEKARLEAERALERRKTEEEKNRREAEQKKAAEAVARQREKQEKAKQKEEKSKRLVKQKKDAKDTIAPEQKRKIATLAGIFLLIGGILLNGWLGFELFHAIQDRLEQSTIIGSQENIEKVVEETRTTPTQIIEIQKTYTPLPIPIFESKIYDTMVSNADGMTMVFIPAGEFIMGFDAGEEDERPEHLVYLDAFWIDQTEVTNSQYALCVNAGRCIAPPDSYYSFSNNYYENDFLDHPVVTINWLNARNYCQWVGRRLPTEAEWEKAAQGTDGRMYPWGEEIDCTHANYGRCQDFISTSPVDYYGEMGASPYGVYDMVGNVSEWVADWYSESYYQDSPYKNPLGADFGIKRVIRGESFNAMERNIRSSNRNMWYPGQENGWANGGFGFRCAMDAE